MRFPAPSEATPNAFNRGNVAERLIGTRVAFYGLGPASYPLISVEARCLSFRSDRLWRCAPGNSSRRKLSCNRHHQNEPSSACYSSCRSSRCMWESSTYRHHRCHELGTRAARGRSLRLPSRPARIGPRCADFSLHVLIQQKPLPQNFFIGASNVVLHLAGRRRAFNRILLRLTYKWIPRIVWLASAWLAVRQDARTA